MCAASAGNSVDEANGWLLPKWKRHPDNSISEDNGRGIPVDSLHHSEPTLEVVLASFTQGGKFDNNLYKSPVFFTALASVVNALSSFCYAGLA